jgi:hypothetical protein
MAWILKDVFGESEDRYLRGLPLFLLYSIICQEFVKLIFYQVSPMDRWCFFETALSICNFLNGIEDTDKHSEIQYSENNIRFHTLFFCKLFFPGLDWC